MMLSESLKPGNSRAAELLQELWTNVPAMRCEPIFHGLKRPLCSHGNSTPTLEFRTGALRCYYTDALSGFAAGRRATRTGRSPIPQRTTLIA
jgi:hypothetical protein